MDICEDLSSEMAELKTIVESILTGRVSPIRAGMLALRYKDIKGCRFDYEKFSCSSLAEVIQKFLFTDFYCVYMHYYKDYVVCLEDRDLARETVINRLQYFLKVQDRSSKTINDNSVQRKHNLKRCPSLRDHGLSVALGEPTLAGQPRNSVRMLKRKLSSEAKPSICSFRFSDDSKKMRCPLDLFELLNIEETLECDANY